MKTLERQEGGNHYTKLKIQPIEYSMANGLDACQHSVIKYVTRFKDKGGLEDLNKAQHFLDMLKEFHYGVQSGGQTAVGSEWTGAVGALCPEGLRAPAQKPWTG